MTREPIDIIPAPTDAAIRAMFDGRAARANDAGLRGQILSATASAPQPRGWRLQLSLPSGLALPRALVLALIVAGLLAVALLGAGSLQQEAPPTDVVTEFSRPFEFAMPAGGSMRLTDPPRAEIVSWAAGPAIPGPVIPEPNDGVRPQPSEGRGVIVALVREGAWSHGGPGRFLLRTAPADFIADLRDTSGVRMGDIVETALDGYPALSVTLPGIGGNDVHVTAPISGLSGVYVRTTNPARLTVADVDGATILVMIWARTAGDLDAWLPVADRFVSSIRFERGDRP